jgi:Anti-sigma factor NepR
MNDWMIPARTTPRLGREIRTKIGRQLRAMYDDVLRQGVPPRFVDLLDRLDQVGARESERAEQKANG